MQNLLHKTAYEFHFINTVNIFVIFCRYDPLQGFECKNGACEDYRVRFTCPLSFCNTSMFHNSNVFNFTVLSEGFLFIL